MRFSRKKFDKAYDRCWVPIPKSDRTFKNGKEIYENDIVEYSWDFCGEKRKNRYVVEWLSGKIEHYPYSVDSGFTLPDSVDGYMVVGNIHENQELIGQSI